MASRCWRCGKLLQVEYEDGACDDGIDRLESAQAIADYPDDWAGTLEYMRGDFQGPTVDALLADARRFRRGTL